MRGARLTDAPSFAAHISAVAGCGFARAAAHTLFCVRAADRCGKMNEVPSVAVVFSVISLVAAATAVVFVASFEFGLRTTARELEPDRLSAVALPPARLHAAASMTHRARLRRRGRDATRSGLRLFQASVIAVGITATFLMFVCLIGFVVLAAVV